MKRNNFTLIELLVVIGIIGILLGILLPAISGSMKEGRKTKDKSTARQIAFAVQAFNSEYGRAPFDLNNTIDPPVDQQVVYDDVKFILDGEDSGGNKIYRGKKLFERTDNLKNSFGNVFNIVLDMDYDGKVTTPYGDVSGSSAVWSLSDDGEVLKSWDK